MHEARAAIAEEQEIKATNEEVEGFVAKLKDFHGSLAESERAMLGTILDSAQGETGAYAFRRRSATEEDWNDLVGLLIDEDTQGFFYYPEGWRQRPEELRQEAERTSLIRRLRKARRERTSSPDDTQPRS